jgi:hypothetical protein
LFDVLTWLQLGVSAGLAAVIVERVRYLLVVAPLSPEGMKFVVAALEAGRSEQVRVWAEEAARTHVGQVLQAGLGAGGSEQEDELSDVLFELQARCLARLRALRVGATVASTLGLLTGILRIRGGLGESAGLLALEAGLAEKVALGQALGSMAVGVATSAVCFYALGVLREAAKGLLAQGTKVAGVLRRGQG